jgi:hypothetical protein
MTSHSRYAFVLALLAGVGFLAIETADAKNSRLNIGQNRAAHPAPESPEGEAEDTP